MTQETEFVATKTAMQEEEIAQTVKNERARLLSFISNRTPTMEDAEDILQDVFYELVRNEPIERTVSWLYRVARNKITDWYRKMRPERLDDMQLAQEEDGDALYLSDILPSMDVPADRQLLLKLISEELTEALNELPEKQRIVFILHEIDGKSLKEISDQTGAGIKTIISRKRYAVMYLQERLKKLYEELLTV